MKMHAREAGFTLVEMIVVISIIGIVMAFSIPNFARGRQEGEVRAAQRELTADLRLAQTTTISQHVDEADASNVDSMGVYFTKDAYTLFYGDGVQTFPQTTFTTVKTKTLAPAALSSAALPSAGSLTLYFRITRDAAGDAGTFYCVPAGACNPTTTFSLNSIQLPEYVKNVILHPSGLIQNE